MKTKMKKYFFILLVFFTGIMQTSCVEAKGKMLYERLTTIIDQVQYDYHLTEEGVVINKITPLSDKGISTLKIPKKIRGKKVVQLGASRTIMRAMDYWVSNLFGCFWLEDGENNRLEPQETYEKIKKIKK